MLDGEPSFAGASARQSLAIGTARLLIGDRDGAAADARRLLLFALGWGALDLVRCPDHLLSQAEADCYGQMLRRRTLGEPVSRIIGSRGFYGREFIVSPDTLDPRPESETLIETALKLMGESYPGGAGLDILDIGTGSGCLLLTLLAEWPAARGTGIDPSAGALAVAAANAARIGVADRCTWVTGYNFAGRERRYPLILSNPPYISSTAVESLAPEVRNHDPRLALDGGADGLEVYRAIADEFAAHTSRGWTLLEAGQDQADAIVSIFTRRLPAARLGRILVVDDVAGMPRCVAIETLS